jgi:alpha-N-arabinofuranosidase
MRDASARDEASSRPGAAPNGLARNPVLPGSHQNPSICRIGGDYYLVTSTCEYFPGLPVYHSRDLVHWRPVGHVLDRPGQLALDGVRPSRGLLAATLRHHAGTFWVTCTLVDGISQSGNFVVTARDPVGPWSDPVWLADAPGFDPALFFDDDGRAWFLGTRPVPDAEPPGRTEIWMRQFDPVGLRLTGPEHVLFRGALVDAVWAEGPRLVSHGGHYYLFVAEGGTEYHHAVTVARGEQVTGPYRNNPANPVLTHRHLGRRQAIIGAGHADLVQDPAGNWHAVLLATRQYGGRPANLGRETFLASVTWEDGWPIMNPGAGRLLAEFPVPLTEHPWPAEPPADDFDTTTLAPAWNMLRTPREEFFSLTDRPGHLRLRLRPETVTQARNPSFIGRRQQHMTFTAQIAMDFEPARDYECAGLVLIRGTDHQIRLVVTMTGTPGRKVVQAIVRRRGADQVIAEAAVPPGRTFLAAEAVGPAYALRYARDPARWQTLTTADGQVLSPSAVGDFTGVYLGMYASAQGHPSASFADFDWFSYAGVPGLPDRG